VFNHIRICGTCAGAGIVRPLARDAGSGRAHDARPCGADAEWGNLGQALHAVPSAASTCEF